MRMLLSKPSLSFCLTLLSFIFVSVAAAHPGPVDGHGCHKTEDGTDFHCHKDRRSTEVFGDEQKPDEAEAADDEADVESEEGASPKTSKESPQSEKKTESEPAKPAQSEAETEESERSPLVKEDADPEAAAEDASELTQLRERVRDLEEDKHRFDRGRAGLWLGISVGAVAASSLLATAIAPRDTHFLSNYALPTTVGSLLTGSVLSLQMGHRSPTAIAGGILVIGNFIAPLVAATSLRN